MIHSLSISNLQSHKQTDLTLSEGLNIICGTSDSGKSAILRALYWLVWNRPSGDSLRSYWGGKTAVRAVFDNGSIERSKDKIEEYIVNDEIKLHAFGLSVPDEVSKVLNLSEINVSKQMDSPFLLSSSPGEVASFFNKVAGLDRIDKAQQNVEKEIRSLTADIKYKTAEQEKLNTQLTDFNYIEKYEIRLEVLETLEEKKLMLTKNVSKFIKAYNSLVDLENELEEASEILKFEKQVDSILGLLEQKNNIIIDAKKIIRIQTLISNTSLQMEEYKVKLSLEPALNSLLEKIEKRKTSTIPLLALNKLVKSIKDTVTNFEEENRNLGLQMERFKKEMPKVCPLCGK